MFGILITSTSIFQQNCMDQNCKMSTISKISWQNHLWDIYLASVWFRGYKFASRSYNITDTLICCSNICLELVWQFACGDVVQMQSELHKNILYVLWCILHKRNANEWNTIPERKVTLGKIATLWNQISFNA